MDRPWTSAIFKEPVVGPLNVGKLNIHSDGQADLVHHGGPDKAVLAYSADNYESWRNDLEMNDLTYGVLAKPSRLWV